MDRYLSPSPSPFLPFTTKSWSPPAQPCVPYPQQFPPEGINGITPEVAEALYRSHNFKKINILSDKEFNTLLSAIAQRTPTNEVAKELELCMERESCLYVPTLAELGELLDIPSKERLLEGTVADFNRLREERVKQLLLKKRRQTRATRQSRRPLRRSQRLAEQERKRRKPYVSLNRMAFPS